MAELILSKDDIETIKRGAWWVLGDELDSIASRIRKGKDDTILRDDLDTLEQAAQILKGDTT